MILQNTSPPTLREDLYTSCMHALDDVGWEHGFSFTAYGFKLGLRAEDVELLKHLRNHLPL
ncbi:MAG: hypothetical protein ACN4GR_10990, partial [Arenicellales bacterium]